MGRPPKEDKLPPWLADLPSERRPISELVPYARNARVHTAEQVQQIAASMREFGVVWPALVNERTGEIIVGHGRVLAAEANGWPDYPVIIARGWTDQQIKAYRIADNKLALNSAWDVQLLAAELGELQGLEALVGFSTDELVDLFKQDEPPDEFPVSDENIEVEHTCPKCGFRWSGGSTAKPAEQEPDEGTEGISGLDGPSGHPAGHDAAGA